MNRRSFLASVAALALSPMLCRAKDAIETVVAPLKSAWEYIEDPLPLRFNILKQFGEIQVSPYIQIATTRGFMTELNPAWVYAPIEQRVYRNTETGELRAERERRVIPDPNPNWICQ